MNEGAAMNRRRVVVAGWYGAANFGDEMILERVVSWINQFGGRATAITHSPAFTRRTVDADAVGYDDLPAIVEALVHADLLVLGGGGLFQDYDRFDVASLLRFPARNVSQFAQFFYLARQLGVPTCLLAQGVGPLRNDEARRIAADLFSTCDHLSVRDEHSLALLHDLGIAWPVTVAPDPVWSTPSSPPMQFTTHFPELSGRKILVINLRDWPFDDEWEAAAVRALDGVVADGWACVWVDFQRAPSATGDALVGDDIACRIVPQLQQGALHRIYHAPGSAEAAMAIAGADAVLAMRLHAVIVAHRQLRPLVAIEYDQKVAGIGASLPGAAASTVPLSAIGTKLRPALQSLFNGGIKASLTPAGVASRAAAALAHAEVLRHALRGRHVAGSRPLDLLGRLLPHVPDAERARIESATRAHPQA